jgi:lipopolysaccharide export system protein LptA
MTGHTVTPMAFRATPVFVLAGLALAAVSGVAMAQIGTGGGPIQVEADNIDFQPASRQAIFSGNAVVIQDGTVLRSSNLRVTYRGNGPNGGDIDKVFADTEVFYTSASERVRGDRATFDAVNNVVVFTGRVIVTQGQNVLRGQQLTLNTLTRASTMRGLDGRVRAVFFPDAAPAGSPAKATPKR